MRKMACAGLLMVFLGVTAAYSASTVNVKGLIVNYTETYVEIKKGRTEYVLYWTEGSKVFREGQVADRAAVDICQKVKARYMVKGGKKELVSLDILADGYCRK